MTKERPQGVSAELEGLLQFLYVCPVGLVEFDDAGTIHRINPEAVNLLIAAVGVTPFGNIFDVLGASGAELRELLTAAPLDAGRIVNEYLVRPEPAGLRALSLNVVRVSSDRVMAMITDVSAMQLRSSLAEALASASGANDAAARVCALTNVLLGAGGAAVYERSDGGGWLCLGQSDELVGGGAEASDGSGGPSHEAFQRGAIVTVRTRAEVVGRYSKWAAHHAEACATVAVPMFGSQSSEGPMTGHVLELWFRDDPGFDRQYFNNLELMASDISRFFERARSSELLRESEQFTRRVLDNLATFVGVVTTDGVLTHVNQAPLTAAAITADDVLGRKFWDCPWWNYAPDVQAKLERAVHRAAGGEIVRYDATIRVAGDKRLVVDFQIAPLLDDRGVVTHLIPSGFDLTERTAAESERDQVHQRLSQLQRLGALLSAAAFPADVCAAAAVVVKEAFAADRCAVGFESGDQLKLFTLPGADEQRGSWTTIPLPIQVAMDGCTLATPAAGIDRATVNALWGVVVEGMASSIFVPLGGDGTLAVMHASSSTLRESERDLLDAMSHLVSSALERARLHEAAEVDRAEDTRALARAEFLADAMARIAMVDGVAARLQMLVDLLVPSMADYATIEAPDQANPVLALAHRDRTLIGRSAQLGAHSHITVPLDLGGGMKGALLLELSDVDRRPFDAHDLALARHVGDRAGILLARARLYEEEHNISLRLQRALLPDQLVRHRDVVLTARHEAAGPMLEVGGDWYDSFTWPGGLVGLVVGDVAGHGIEATAAMGRLRSAVAAFAPLIGPDPAALLDALDLFMRGPNGTRYATACCAVFDPSSGELRYSSAGHLPMLVLSPNGRTSWLDDAQAPPLCQLPIDHRPSGSVVLERGALLVQYSDGLVERRGEALDVGLSRLEEAIRRLTSVGLDDIANRLVDHFVASHPIEDDIVVLAMRYDPT